MLARLIRADAYIYWAVDMKKPTDRFILGARTFLAISAVEGLKICPEGLAIIISPLSQEEKRAAIIARYLSISSPARSSAHTND